VVLGGSSVLDGEPVVDILLIRCPFVYLGQEILFGWLSCESTRSTWLFRVWRDRIFAGGWRVWHGLDLLFSSALCHGVWCLFAAGGADDVLWVNSELSLGLGIGPGAR